jgi:TolA-binding protein
MNSDERTLARLFTSTRVVEGAPPEARARLGRKLEAAIAAGALAGATTLTQGTAIAAGGGVGGAGWALKAAAVGVAVLGLVGAGALYSASRSNTSAPKAASSTSAPGRDAGSAAALSSVAPSPPAASSGVTDGVESAAPPPTKRLNSAPPEKHRAEDLTEELALLRAAQRDLGAGNATQALEALRQYSERFPRGALRPEAKIARIQALCASGQAELAGREAAQFVRRNPRSPLAERVRHGCQGK